MTGDKKNPPIDERIFLDDLYSIVSRARSKAYATINLSLVERNWMIGRRIVEQEQQGKAKATYGKHVIELASRKLTDQFGNGFSVTNIKNFRRFYLDFCNLSIGQTPSDLLPWSHYERLIRVKDPEARDWYAQEALNQTWSFRTLDRNINTQYYDRLLISQKKEPVIKEMEDKTRMFQTDKLAFIKNPVIAEFLGFSPDSSFQESELERAIIGNMEKFLMEMGKGYALVARQQHIRTAENDYYIDLVFYNYLIKSFILIDLKADKISYQDVGQMDMYLQIYDQIKKERTTILPSALFFAQKRMPMSPNTQPWPKTTKCSQQNTSCIFQAKKNSKMRLSDRNCCFKWQTHRIRTKDRFA